MLSYTYIEPGKINKPNMTSKTVNTLIRVFRVLQALTVCQQPNWNNHCNSRCIYNIIKYWL